MPICFKITKWHDVRNRFKYPINMWLLILNFGNRNILAKSGLNYAHSRKFFIFRTSKNQQNHANCFKITQMTMMFATVLISY